MMYDGNGPHAMVQASLRGARPVANVGEGQRNFEPHANPS
jgi:hypothetical protein